MLDLTSFLSICPILGLHHLRAQPIPGIFDCDSVLEEAVTYVCDTRVGFLLFAPGLLSTPTLYMALPYLLASTTLK